MKDGDGDTVMDPNAAAAKRDLSFLLEGANALRKTGSPLHKKTRAEVANKKDTKGKEADLIDDDNHHKDNMNKAERENNEHTEGAPLEDVTPDSEASEVTDNKSINTGPTLVTPDKTEATVGKSTTAKRKGCKTKVSFSHTEEIPVTAIANENEIEEDEEEDHDNKEEDDGDKDNNKEIICNPPKRKSYAKVTMQTNLGTHFETIPPKNAKKVQKHKLFLTFMYKINKSSNKANGDPTSCLRASIKEIFELMQKHVDKKVVLYKYKQKHNDERDVVFCYVFGLIYTAV